MQDLLVAVCVDRFGARALLLLDAGALSSLHILAECPFPVLLAGGRKPCRCR